jgi:hypothetical protein
MPSLTDFVDKGAQRGRVSVIDRLPKDVRDQLIAAQLAGSRSSRQMLLWLHNDPDLPDLCRDVTRSMLQAWFVRRGIRFGGGHDES